MPGRGRPKKCSRKLNFRKDENLPNETICNEQNILLPVSENDDIQYDINDTASKSVVIDTSSPTLPESLMQQIPSTSGSIMNNDNVPITDDIINRQFPVKLENNAQVCFFNSICQIFYSMPKFLANLKYTPTTNHVVIAMQGILERMKICDLVYPNSYIHRIALNDCLWNSTGCSRSSMLHSR